MPTRLSRLRPTLAVVGLLIWIVAPVLAVWFFSQQALRTSLISESITWAPVLSNNEPVITPVDVVLQRSPAPIVVAPAMVGLIEAVLAEPGQTLRSGQPVLVVDGITRIGVASDRPFARRLSVGDVGMDVTALNGLLSALSFPAADSDRFTDTTRAGVRAFSKSIGAGDQATFNPSWVIFLPSADILVAASELIVGRQRQPPVRP